MADIGNKPSTWDDANVKANVQAVIDDSRMDHLGDVGDIRHLAGAGDHTPYSTHKGKNGYPTQGKVHAHDFKMSQADQNKFENWVRLEWKAGRLRGLKYMNVNNRHWNIQTTANWNKAKAGTIKSTYSGDHHVHLSYENGSVESDLIKRWIAYRNGVKPSAPKPQPVTLIGDDVYRVVKLKGSDKPVTWFGNYITRRWIRDERDLAEYLKMAGQSKVIEVDTAAELDKYGVVVGANPTV